LAEIAADCPHVPQCGCSYNVAGLRQGRESLEDACVARDVRDSRRGSDAHATAVRRFDPVTLDDRPEIDDHVRLRQLLGDRDEQVCPSAERDGARLTKLSRSVVDRRCVTVEEWMAHGI
jgi:hypothetical protein